VIPVHKNEHHTPFKNIRIAYENNWQKTMWRSIVSAYGSSPFFAYYDYLIEPVFKQQPDLLLEYNTQLTELILKLLKQPQKLNFSDAFVQQNIENDYRNNFGKHYRKNSIEFKKYHQPFEEKHGFQQDLSILDILFNEGPNAMDYLN
ncbi:MAG: WbqC family protein, partial [Bacteroidia bacterium]